MLPFGNRPRRRPAVRESGRAEPAQPRRSAPTEQEIAMLDLNTATAEELDEVPALKGHGFEIVRYREERGRFTSLRQLDEVPGLSGQTGGIAGQVAVVED
jgi:competence protein ComEA